MTESEVELKNFLMRMKKESEKDGLKLNIKKKKKFVWFFFFRFQSNELQHTSLPCPSLTSGACSNSCPLSQWWHPTISSCHPLFLLLSVFPSIRLFSNESVFHIHWSKNWSFSFSISPSNEYSGLSSFRIDRFYLFAIQGTLKSLLQHHSSIA